MISDPPLYTGTGGGVKAHSIRRRKLTPPVRQRTLPESSSMTVSPIRRPALVRQRSLSPAPDQLVSAQPPPSPATLLPSIRRMKHRYPSYSDIVTTNRRLVLALDQFTCTALPFYLELINRYTAKIQKLKVDQRSDEERYTVEQASKAVRQLGSLMFEMEVLRSFLETEAELRYFDRRVNPAKINAHKAVNRLKGLCPEQASKLELTSTRCNLIKLDQRIRRYSETQLTVKDRKISQPSRKESASLNDISYTSTMKKEGTKEDMLLKKSNEKKKELRFDEVIHDLQSDALRICSEKIKENPNNSNSETWKLLEEEISDVKLLIETYHEKRVRVRRTNNIPSNSSTSNTNSSSSHPPHSQPSSRPTSRMYPMAGAVVGSCIGAPVGFLAGIKIGGLASLSGIIFGYSTGSIVKKFAQQQEKIDSVFNEIGPQDRGRLKNFDLQAKRAVSLPDMLNDDDTEDSENKYTIGNARKIWMRQSQAKSSENLLI